MHFASPRLIGCGAVLSALLLARGAQASANYPQEIIAVWNVTNPAKLPVPGMGCTLCHSTDQGKAGTITKPFGKTMQAHGVVKTNVRSLDAALVDVGNHAFIEPLVDSDHDLVPDYIEVAVDHTDPNDPNDHAEVPVGPAPEGGGGGEGGAGSGQAANGGEGARGPVLPPVFTPPAAGDLPPPFEHGCALTLRDQRVSATGSLLLLLAAIVASRGRRTRRSS